MQKIIVGNWKMHGTQEMARDLIVGITKQFDANSESTIVLCPPAPLLYQVAAQLATISIQCGGQDCHEMVQGAYTGDISAGMLKEAGCHYVIVGHSERRQYHGETSDVVSKKAACAMAIGLTPIICIGETAAERAAGNAESVIQAQLEQSLPKVAADGHFLLAYEPVWAIGSGKTPTAAEIEHMHGCILSIVATFTGLAPEQIKILYGGSVTAQNAKEIMHLPGVDGVLVGGASLKLEEFCQIITAATELETVKN